MPPYQNNLILSQTIFNSNQISR